MALQDHRTEKSQNKTALFALGFRPFFLFAAISAALLMLLWLYVYQGGAFRYHYYSANLWHGHEMIFGYTIAVIAGFLLAAVRNWTGLQTPHGKTLAALFVLWLAGRLVPLFASLLPDWLIAVVDLSFLPALAVMLSIPILRKHQKHNLVFLFILAALTAANLMVHLQVLGVTQATAIPGLYFAVYLIVFLIAVMGGRVIPFFTESAIANAKVQKWKLVEYGSLGGLLILIALILFNAPAVVIVPVALFTALAHCARLYGWYQKSVWSIPLLWILHLAYAWLITGLILKALAAAGLVNPLLALHAFTAGAIGTITLGMMARVTLGHTGRQLLPGSATSWVFVLINLAAFARVFLPLFYPAGYKEFILISGLLWSAAFVIFIVAYAVFLIRPRIDGRPG